MTDAGGERPQSTRAAILIPFGIVTLVWSSTWIVIRDQISSVPPSWSVTYRFTAASIAMLLYALARRESLRPDARQLGFAFLVGLGQFCVNFNFVYRAEAYIASGLVAVVFALMLVPNALLARVFLGQKLGRQLLLGSGIAIAGISLLFVHEARVDTHGPAQVLTGLGFVGLAILGASAGNVLQATRTARAYPLIATLAWAMMLGTLLDAAVAWALTGPPVIEWRVSYLGGILYLGLIGSALTFPLYYAVIRVIGPAKAAYSNVLVPVLAMLISTLFEGYRWSTLSAAGGLLALAGLVIALTARRPNR